MPRAARRKSESGIYHIMLRGINKQTIFQDSEDYENMLRALGYCREKSGIELYAYCFMPNHIHLLIKEGCEPLEATFKRLGCKYVYWYNLKYDRVGHLFQDRFKSEVVEDDEYFLTVLRYIHNNPVKAKLTEKAELYEYSSYKNYLKDSSIVDTEKVYTMLSKKELIAFHNKENYDECLDVIDKQAIRITNEAAERIIKNATNNTSSADFSQLSKNEKLAIIQDLKRKGLSIHQIMNYTDCSYYFIQKA